MTKIKEQYMNFASEPEILNQLISNIIDMMSQIGFEKVKNHWKNVIQVFSMHCKDLKDLNIRRNAAYGLGCGFENVP
jgi:hypothetical protein